MKEQLTTEEIKTCPLCLSKQLPEVEQPASGLHAYNIVYECGAEVTCVIGYDEAEIDLKCGEVKEDFIGTLIACKNVEEGYFQEQMNRTETKEQKINFECLKWLITLSHTYSWNKNGRSIETPHDFDIEWDDFLDNKDCIYFKDFIQEAIEGYLKNIGGTYEVMYTAPDIELTIVTVFDRFDVKDVVGRELEAKWNLMKKVYEKESK